MKPMNTYSANLTLGIIALCQQSTKTPDLAVRAQLEDRISDLCQRWTALHGQQ